MRAPVFALFGVALALSSACDDPPADAARERRPRPVAEPPEEVAEAPEEADPEGAPLEAEQPYDEEADAARDIEAAVATARAEDKRVLLVFGANWCVWCRRLDWVLQNHDGVGRALSESFEVVHVDTGARRSGKNASIVERYGDPVQHGLPVLVVLDGEGQVVTTQETGSLEEGDRHDPEKILAFLGRAAREQT